MERTRVFHAVRHAERDLDSTGPTLLLNPRG
jgi:hypothetical protein